MNCKIRKGGWFCPRTKKKCTKAMNKCTAPASSAVQRLRRETAARSIQRIASSVDSRLNRLKRLSMFGSLFTKS